MATATFSGQAQKLVQASAKKQKKSDKKSKENKQGIEKYNNKSVPTLGGKFTHNRQLSQIKCSPFIKETKQKKSNNG